MDQAEGLRVVMERNNSDTFASREETPLHSSPIVLSVTSGKGGVGKTNVVANLAFAFTQMGRRVLVLDADLGLANIDILLGLTPRYTIEHFFSQKKVFSEILIKGPGGMSILPASSGVLDLVDLSESQKICLLNEIDLIGESIDILLIDTGAGISSNVMYFNMAAQESIVVATSEPTSITDAYALIKMLTADQAPCRIGIVVNAAQDMAQGEQTYATLSKACRNFLKINPPLLGIIRRDAKVKDAIRAQTPLLTRHPGAIAAQDVEALARQMPLINPT